jgi:pilus assembly protein CpaE
MKIAVISPNPAHLQQMRRVLHGASHEVVTGDGGKSRMRSMAEEERPDLMIVDGMCCDTQELEHVEYVTNHFPQTAVMLLCATHTPDFLINSMRAGVREVLPSPPPADALQAAVERVATKLSGLHQRKGRILAFVSCKGGSGATFLATNLAWQLAKKGSVLLVDLNLQFGDALSFVHDGSPASTIADVANDISRLDASLLTASVVKVAPNYDVLAAPDKLAEAMEVRPESIDAILRVAEGQYDFVLLDLARNLDTHTIKALDRAYRVYAVIQAGLPDLRNARKLLDAFAALGYTGEKTELIVNRFQKGGLISLEQVQRTVGAARITTVPNSWREVNTAINHGDPLARTSLSNPVVRQLADMASLLGPKAEPSRGLLDKLFKRA